MLIIIIDYVNVITIINIGNMPFVGNLRVGGTYKYYVEVSLTYLNVTKLPCGTTAPMCFV